MSKWLEGRVVGQKHWTDRLLSLQVAAPLGPYQAGQFVKLALDIGGERIARPYSFVNPPGSEPHEFYYNIVAEGPLTPRLADLRTPAIRSARSRTSTGFTRCSEKPAARLRSRSLCCP